MKFFGIIFCSLSISGLIIAQNSPQKFTDYPAKIYKGNIHKPKWIRHVQGDEWRDELNKFVEPLEVNFAGKYYLAGHSLGTGVWYFTLTDLTTARELNILDNFATTEIPVPRMRDGRRYSTRILSRPNSRLLIVQYRMEPTNVMPESCREKAYLLQNQRLRRLGKAWSRCRD
ncbi:MAG: hypothetical protein ACKVQW_15285 [Pyrinomonadaceae bacterium]